VGSLRRPQDQFRDENDRLILGQEQTGKEQAQADAQAPKMIQIEVVIVWIVL
jgi:hypothetical protein